MENQEKNNHGGSRVGAGRKKKDVEARRFTISISGTPTEIEMIKKMAMEENKTVSRFLIEKVLK